MNETIALLDELIKGQKNQLFQIARQRVPQVTPDDLLQPNDFVELETDPIFRYEEGLLTGLETAKMALLAKIAEKG